MPGSSMSPDTATSSLLQACAQGRPNPDLMDQWLLAGANIHAQMTSGKTALMLAAWAGHADTAVYLYQSGALINVQDTSGKSAHSGAKDPARTALLEADRAQLQHQAQQRTLERLARIAAQKKPPRL